MPCGYNYFQNKFWTLSFNNNIYIILKTEKPEELAEIDLPALTMKIGGYVMLSKIDDQQVHYLDMKKGWVTETIEEFSKHWDGITILAK